MGGKRTKDQSQLEPGIGQLGARTPVSMNSALSRWSPLVSMVGEHRVGLVGRINLGLRSKDRSSPTVLQPHSSEPQARWKVKRL